MKVLLVEDSPADAELVLRSLRNLPMNIAHHRVSSEASLKVALASFGPDIVLSDFHMPGFGGEQSLRVTREQAPHVPFLFVSGTLGEEVAIQALHHGALDYLFKDNLRRLPSAVERALEVARGRCAYELTQRALRESEERFRTIVETSQDWIWETDAQLMVIYSNHAVSAMLGHSAEDVIGTCALSLVADEDQSVVADGYGSFLAQKRGWHRWRVRYRHRDGSLRVLESTSTPVLDAADETIGFRGVAQDVTERLRQKARIEQLARIHAVVGALGNAVLRATTREELFLSACRVAVEQGGFKAAGLGVLAPGGVLNVVARFGDPAVLELVAPSEPMPIEELSQYQLHPGIVAFREGRNVAVEDFTRSDLPAELRAQMAAVGIASEIALPIGAEPWGLLALFSESERIYDAEEIELLERLAADIDYAVDFLDKGERLEHLAYHHPVTGLANRAAFQRDVVPALRAGNQVVAVVSIDRFSDINDSRGRGIGDQLLGSVGRRLQALVGQAGIVAHSEGDAFLVAYPAAAPEAEECDRLEAVLQEMEKQPFVIEDEDIHVTFHGGVAMGPVHGADGKVLERNALIASAEGGRRNVRLHTFSHELSGHAARRIELERDLRRAIEAEELEVHFQPKFATSDRRLLGAEALLRWRHPRHGWISPAEFIPVLEETGLIVPTGRWVMQHVLQVALDWRHRHLPDIRIAVNVSARELRHKHFMEECARLLGEHGGNPPLDVELTESLLMDDVDHSIRQLQGLRDLGCRIAIDDFGTGYSSLSYLARLPVDELKIDLSFISQLTRSPRTASLVANIIALAHSLSLTSVAEGVEDEDQAKHLRLLRCDVLQGYLLGRPVAAEAFVREHFR